MALSDADMVDFRTAIASDVAELGELLVAAGLDPDLATDVEVVGSDRSAETVVGWFGGRIVCAARWSGEPNVGPARIDGIVVHPDQRGRGIGTVLLWWVSQRCRALGMVPVLTFAGGLEVPLHPSHQQRGW